MQHLQELHRSIVGPETGATAKLSATQADPFAILRAFVKGTDDLFPVELRKRVYDLCMRRSVPDYMEMASNIDGIMKNYDATTSVELVQGHRVLCSILKKYPFSTKESCVDTRAVAIEKWYAAEAQCRATNVRLKQHSAARTLPKFIHHARRLITDALRELNPAAIMKILADGEHGKGSTTECDFEASSTYFKYQRPQLYVTKSARHYAKAAISLNKGWAAHLTKPFQRKILRPVVSSYGYIENKLLDEVVHLSEPERISFVPKDARSMRPIGIGHTLMMYLQLGVKRAMVEDLKKVGVDLTDQTKNQRMAKRGSCEGMFDTQDFINPGQDSTIDLASASDTVSIGICELLLPPEWFGLLSDLRHTCGIIDNKLITYNKMSAMGNGFTFPLESLIFWAVARATAEVLDVELTDDELAIYGDDIICPQHMSQDLITNLEYCGFSVNTEKTFTSGQFKESCGLDYFQGINVRPFYLKRGLKTTGDLYHVGNTILPRACSGIYPRIASGYSEIYRYIADIIAEVGPVLYGPISDVLSLDKDGKANFGTNEYSLAVPLSFAALHTNAIDLSIREKVALFNDKSFKKVPRKQRNVALTSHISCNLPYAWTRVTRFMDEPHVNERLRLLTCMDALCRNDVDAPDESNYSSREERFGLTGSGTIRVVRKRAPVHTFYLRAVPNWDGVASESWLARHPCFGSRVDG